MERRTEYPLARAEDLISRPLGDELIVYDLDRHQAHCLNSTAAAVWKKCDGASSPEEIASALEGELGGTIATELVSAAIASLGDKGLLKRATATMDAHVRVSRRELVRRAGLAAAVVAPPLVMTLVVPTPAQAASCLGTGSVCGSGAQCCSGICSSGICI